MELIDDARRLPKMWSIWITAGTAGLAAAVALMPTLADALTKTQMAVGVIVLMVLLAVSRAVKQWETDMAAAASAEITNIANQVSKLAIETVTAVPVPVPADTTAAQEILNVAERQARALLVEAATKAAQLLKDTPAA